MEPVIGSKDVRLSRQLSRITNSLASTTSLLVVMMFAHDYAVAETAQLRGEVGASAPLAAPLGDRVLERFEGAHQHITARRPAAALALVARKPMDRKIETT